MKSISSFEISCSYKSHIQIDFFRLADAISLFALLDREHLQSHMSILNGFYFSCTDASCLFMSLFTVLVTNITNEWLLSFMNKEYMSIHVILLKTDVVTSCDSQLSRAIYMYQAFLITLNSLGKNYYGDTIVGYKLFQKL